MTAVVSPPFGVFLLRALLSLSVPVPVPVSLSFSLCQSQSLSLSLSVPVSCLCALHACTVTRGRAGVRAFEIDGRLVLAQLPHKAAPVGQRLGHGIDSSPRLVVRENG